MIPAARSRWFGWWFSHHARRRIERRFDRLLIRGLERLDDAVRDHPVLVVSNHTSWWDPLVVIHLCWRVRQLEARALMDAKNLRALPFFRKVGAFGVDLDDPADGARGVRYAAGLLDVPGRLVWIFAQGREVPVTVRPLGFRRGAAAVARVASGAVVLPCALRYELGGRPDPDIYVSFGAPVAVERDLETATLSLEEAVGRELQAIESAVAGGASADFEVLHAKRPSLLFALATRVLSRLARIPGH